GGSGHGGARGTTAAGGASGGGDGDGSAPRAGAALGHGGHRYGRRTTGGRGDRAVPEAARPRKTGGVRSCRAARARTHASGARADPPSGAEEPRRIPRLQPG